jgi:hypothetical protein
MLTHGWRRFQWADVLQNKVPAFDFVPEYEGHIITGKITDKRSGLAVENALTYLSAPGYRFELGSSVSNKAGQLQFDINNFYGKNEIVVQTDTRKDSSYRLDVMSPFAEKFSSGPMADLYLSENMQQDLVSRSVGMQVQNAFLGDSLQKFETPKMGDSTPFYGVADRKYFLDEYTRFTTMEEVMREYIAGVSIHKRKQKFYFRVLNEPYQNTFDDDPLILMDGVPVFDATKIIEMDPLKVKKIEVVSRKYFLGAMESSGIVSYSTYKGDLEGYQLDPNALVLEYDGLQLKREFYSPVYKTAEQQASHVPDFRNLLYWSPDIRPDAGGKKQISFFTSDRQGKYLLLIEGINRDGKACSQKVQFDVLK